jgi:hypothetical protein
MYFATYWSALLFTLLFLVFSAGTSFLFFKQQKKLAAWDDQVHRIFSFLTHNIIRISLAIALLLLLFFMDFVRDYLFKNVNMQINYMYYIEQGQVDRFNYTDSVMERLLEGWSAQALYYLKYALTILLTIVYAVMCWLFLRFTYPHVNTVPYVRLFYGTTFWLLCFAFILAMYPFGYEIKHNLYLISMEIGHFLQSSLPPLLLVLVIKMAQQLRISEE